MIDFNALEYEPISEELWQLLKAKRPRAHHKLRELGVTTVSRHEHPENGRVLLVFPGVYPEKPHRKAPPGWEQFDRQVMDPHRICIVLDTDEQAVSRNQE